MKTRINISYFILSIMTVIILGVITFIDLPKPNTMDDIQPEIVNSYDPFSDISIFANAAIVMDVDLNKIIYSKNANSQMPLASLAKIMTAYVANKFSEKEIVTVNGSSISQIGDTGLFLNERWSLAQLVQLMLVSSSNDGAHAIASDALDGGIEDFIFVMNDEARKMGLSQTYFTSASGLDIDDSLVTAYGSPYDIASLIARVSKEYPLLFQKTRLSEISVNSENYGEHIAINTNPTTNNIPGLIMSKTGYTQKAGGNLALLFQAGLGRTIAVVILGSTKEERFLDAEKLVWTTIEYLNI